MTSAAERLFGRACSYCGHQAPHPLPCPGTITTGSGKTQTEKPCPCIADHHTEEPR